MDGRGGESKGECGGFMVNAGSHGTEQMEESGSWVTRGFYHSYTAIGFTSGSDTQSGTFF